MWKYKKGEVVRIKDTLLWGHVVGFVSLNNGQTKIVAELENGSRGAFMPYELETEVDQ